MVVTRNLIFHGFCQCEVGPLGHTRIRKAGILDVLSVNGIDYRTDIQVLVLDRLRYQEGQ